MTNSDQVLAGAIPSAAAVEDARRLLRDQLPETRQIAARRLGSHLGVRVQLKLEAELPTGSFKPRGALYALARRLRGGAVREVVASSTGNHGAAVAWAARALGVPATVFLPERPNPVKRRAIAELGATIRETGPDLAAAARAAREHSAGDEVYYLDDATDPVLPAGPATIAVEILERAPETRSLVVPMGDTALIRGVGAVAKRHDREVAIIGVQAERAPSYYLSWKNGRPVATATCHTIADGLATRTPVAENVQAIRSLVDDVVLVSEDDLLDAVAWLILEEHVVAEPSGAAAVAAALALGRSALPGPAVLLVTGANLSESVLAAVGATRRRRPGMAPE